jgi:hypothetical protein
MSSKALSPAAWTLFIQKKKRRETVSSSHTFKPIRQAFGVVVFVMAITIAGGFFAADFVADSIRALSTTVA